MENLISKISVATVYGPIDKKNPNADVMRVAGIATGVKTGVSTYGDWTALIGDFKAVNLETSEVFRAGKCFLPETAMSLVLGALGGEVSSVQFAFEIITVEADTSCGYEYRVKPLVESSESDPLNQLVSSVPGFLALPSPEGEESESEKPKGKGKGKGK